MVIPEEVLLRKGPAKLALLTDEVRSYLNKGVIESVNLIEWLAVDHCELVGHVLAPNYRTECKKAILSLKQPSAMQSIVTVGKKIAEIAATMNDKNLFSFLSKHASDSVRCWACYMVVNNADIGVEDRLEAMRHFAADRHFGVREVAWMSVRPDLDTNLIHILPILKEWATDADENVRRFVSESIRPRGVWCKHIDLLKSDPAIALPVLDLLKSDSSRYVQDSVGNWLNDASKTNPEWVLDLCEQWKNESPTKQTAYIVKRGLRSVKY